MRIADKAINKTQHDCEEETASLMYFAVSYIKELSGFICLINQRSVL